ncbi:MAG TPA: aminotransferase, partial [Kiloniellales bacterium]|nr:aminotransferase [Kiloniellales bacterium]
KLAEITPKGLNRAFYGTSGSEANDTMVRLVRRYWNILEKPEKKMIIGRNYGYHGSTMAAASLGGFAGMHKMSDLPLPGFVHIMPPYQWQFGKPGESAEEFGLRAAKALEDKILELGPERVAAFIGEPILGAGGVIIPPDSYWPEIQRICRQYDVLLVADEVICGFGRTGQWFGSDTFGIEPDLMPMAKGLTSGYLPLSALMISDKVAEVMIGKGGEFFHGYTYDGHPVSCAVALANLALIEELDLVRKTREETGPYMLQKLQDTLGEHPLVGEIRGCGLIGAIELKVPKGVQPRSNEAGKLGLAVRNAMFQQGAIMRATWDTMVYSPPLIIEKDEIDLLVGTLKSALDKVSKEQKKAA